MWSADAENLVARIAGCGPVLLSTDQLRNARAFKHVAHPLQVHTEMFVAGMGADTGDALTCDAGLVREEVWARLVAEQLVPVLDVEVTLAAGPYNSAWARYVDGLSDNDAALPSLEVCVDGDVVGMLFADVAGVTLSGAPVGGADGVETLPDATVTGEVRSVLTAGVAGLVGRRVEIVFVSSAEPLVGVFAGVAADGTYAVWAGDGLYVVRSESVAHLWTCQLTAAEEDVHPNR